VSGKQAAAAATKEAEGQAFSSLQTSRAEAETKHREEERVEEERGRREEEQRLAKEAEEIRKLEAAAAAELEVHSEKSNLFLDKSHVLKSPICIDLTQRNILGH